MLLQCSGIRWSGVDLTNTADMRPVFFMHIPKTGGISLTSFLQRSFAPCLICPQPLDGRAWDYSAEEVARYRLFAGHFDADFIDLIDPNGFKLTILRNPLSRVTSTYDFWRSISLEWADRHLSEAPLNAPRFARTHTFGTFLRTENPFVREAIDNLMVRQLLGRRFTEFAAHPAKAAQAAFSRLQTFDWFSTTETLSTALPALAAQMKAAPPDELHLHRTYMPQPHEPRVTITPSVPSLADERYCAQMNQADVLLYRLAADRLASPSGPARATGAMTFLNNQVRTLLIRRRA